MNKKFFFRLVSFLLLFIGVISIRFFIGGDYSVFLKQIMSGVLFFLGVVYGYVYSLYLKENRMSGGD